MNLYVRETIAVLLIVLLALYTGLLLSWTVPTPYLENQWIMIPVGCVVGIIDGVIVILIIRRIDAWWTRRRDRRNKQARSDEVPNP